jgi:hypothetical protein
MQVPNYHRSYRHLSTEPADIGKGVLFGLLPGVVILLGASVILPFHGRWVVALLEWIGIPVTPRISYYGRLLIVVPEVPSFAPAHSVYPAVVAIAGWIVGLVLLMPLSRLTPVRVIGGVASLVSGVSGTFFYFAGERFPYTALDFANVWIRAEFVVWLIIPALIAIILGTLPLDPATTLLYSAMTLLYAYWFSAIRLTLFLAFLHYAGLIWLPCIYFLGGFLLDFLYIVSYYSMAVSRTTRILRQRREVWRW